MLQQLSTPLSKADGSWCPFCKKTVKLLRVTHAAKNVDVTNRTIYRYIDEGLIHAVKVAGKTYRVCGDCLFR